MAEYPFDKPGTLTDGEANWSFNPSTGADTAGSVPSAPDAPRRLSGFSNSLPDAPSASEFNYLFREALKACTWLAGIAEREFDDLYDGIENTEPGDIFRVRRDAQDSRIDSATASGLFGGGTVTAISTDGRHVYAGVSGGDVVAVRGGAPGTEVWTASGVTGGAVACVDACGDFVAVYTATGTTYEIAFLDPDDGSDAYAKISRTPPTVDKRIAANGDLVAFNHGTAGRLAEIYQPSTVTVLTAAIQWGGATAGAIQGLALTDDRLYMCGSANDAGAHVQAHLVDGTATAQWSATIAATSGTPNARDVCTDGDRVFVVGDRINASGLDASVWCYSKAGALLWRADLGVDSEACACDDRYLYVAGTGGTIGIFDPATGHRIDRAVTIFARSIDFITTDGVRVYTGNSTSLVRASTGRKTTRWARADGANTHRRPFYNLATPA